MNETDIYQEWPAPPAWRSVVACCWEQRVGAARTQRVVPDGHADLLFFDNGDIQIVGLHDTVALPDLPAATRIRGVRLRPAAVADAFAVPASELHNATLPAEDLLGSRAARGLAGRRELDAWVRSIEPDQRAERAVEHLQTGSVSDTADALGVTGRHLRRLLLEHAGLSPKVLQRVQRFQRFVRSIDAGAELAVAAAGAGYADQAHLTREVRVLAGATPEQLAAERRGP